MNTKEIAKELIPWLEELSAGKTLEIFDTEENSVPTQSVTLLVESIKKGYRIEIKQIPMPEPPEGQEWHNPHKLTPDRVCISRGWRLLLKSEIVTRQHKVVQMWHPTLEGVDRWIVRAYGDDPGITYRVRAVEHPVGSLQDPHSQAYKDLVHAAIVKAIRHNYQPANAPIELDVMTARFVKDVANGAIKYLEVNYGD